MIALDHPLSPTATDTLPNEPWAAFITPAERALIVRAQAGDRDAFGAIFEQYHAQIFTYVYRLMGNENDADQMTQDTFLKAWLAFPKTSDDLRLKAWLYQIALNVCRDEARHRKLVTWQPWETFIATFHPKQVMPDTTLADILRAESRAEAGEQVRLVLDHLHPHYQQILILREYQELSYDEIGQVLNLTFAAVKSVLFRARREFRDVAVALQREGSVSFGIEDHRTRSGSNSATTLGENA